MARPAYLNGELRSEGEAIRNNPQTVPPHIGPPLPKNAVDVQKDSEDVAQNQRIAIAIRALVEAEKTDSKGQRMLIGWRLYPNKAHPNWNPKRGDHGGWEPAGDGHSCGCGCGCGS